MPGFIHSENCKSLMDRIIEAISRIGTDAVSISLDGTSFDSSQYRELCENVDCRIWRLLKPTWIDILRYNYEFLRFAEKLDFSKVV